MPMGGLWGRIRQFMAGRRGADGLSLFLVAVGALRSFVGQLLGQRWVLWICWALWLLAFWRMLSKNTGARERENQWFLGWFSPAARKAALHAAEAPQRRAEKEVRRAYRIFKCPGCGQKLRVPRGRGKIRIHCSRCGKDFVKKS